MNITHCNTLAYWSSNNFLILFFLLVQQTIREGDRKILKLYLVKSDYILHNLVMIPVRFVEIHE